MGEISSVHLLIISILSLKEIFLSSKDFPHPLVNITLNNFKFRDNRPNYTQNYYYCIIQDQHSYLIYKNYKHTHVINIGAMHDFAKFSYFLISVAFSLADRVLFLWDFPYSSKNKTCKSSLSELNNPEVVK